MHAHYLASDSGCQLTSCFWKVFGDLDSTLERDNQQGVVCATLLRTCPHRVSSSFGPSKTTAPCLPPPCGYLPFRYALIINLHASPPKTSTQAFVCRCHQTTRHLPKRNRSAPLLCCSSLPGWTESVVIFQDCPLHTISSWHQVCETMSSSS